MSARDEPAPATGRRGQRLMFCAPRRQVLTKCPRSGQSQPTHARLTLRQFAALNGPLLYWCGRCRAAHEARRDTLWLAADGGRPDAPAMPAPRLAAVPSAPREMHLEAPGPVANEELVFTGRGGAPAEEQPQSQPTPVRRISR